MKLSHICLSDGGFSVTTALNYSSLQSMKAVNKACCRTRRAMSKHAGPRLPAIVECLCPSLNNIYECQRITVTAFFSEVGMPGRYDFKCFCLPRQHTVRKMHHQSRVNITSSSKVVRYLADWSVVPDFPSF